MKSKTNSKENSLYDSWIRLKKEAIETGDFNSYQEFLKMVQKEFTKLYGEVTKPELISLVEQVLKTASCELKGIMIKYKKSKLPF